MALFFFFCRLEKIIFKSSILCNCNSWNLASPPPPFLSLLPGVQGPGKIEDLFWATSYVIPLGVLIPHLDCVNTNWEGWVRWGQSALILEISRWFMTKFQALFFQFCYRFMKFCHNQHLGTKIIPDSAFIYLFNDLYFMPVIPWMIGRPQEGEPCSHSHNLQLVVRDTLWSP